MRQKSAFTVIEMAIVLAIIGLIVGGIMAGVGLQQTSRLRQVITQTTSYAIAIQQFKTQYGEFPGDFSTAVRVWGRADDGADLTANCATPLTDASTTNPKGTCNGDGDGRIHGMEQFRAWQQMANAGLISSTYTGVSDAAFHPVPGTNAPAGAIKNSVYEISSYGPYVSDTLMFDGDYANTLTFGKKDATADPFVNIISPKEAYDIDSKVDDGRPGMGLIRTYKGTVLPGPDSNGKSCVGYNGGDVWPGTDPATTEYRRKYSDTLCFLFFLYGYGIENAQVNR